MVKQRILVKVSCCYLAVILLAGCGAGYHFKKAGDFQKRGAFVQAIEKYRVVSGKYPASKYAPEALYAAANLYRKELQVYPEARKLYAELIQRYPESQEWVKLAKRGILDSPDYFPLEQDYLLVEGDSQTLGRNMQLEKYCTRVSTGVYSVTKKYFAGDNMVSKVERFYEKVDYELREMSFPGSGQYAVLLSFPFELSKSWKTARDNRNLRITIVDNDAVVTVKAGKFSGCIKLREEDLFLPNAFKYEYYAPGVGCVLTTIGSAGSQTEYRNTELISYKFKKQ